MMMMVMMMALSQGLASFAFINIIPACNTFKE